MTNPNKALSLANLILLGSILLAACSPSPDAAAPNAPQTAKAKLVPMTDTLTLTVPTAGWTVAPNGAYLVGDEIWTLYQLTPPAGMAAQVIERATCSQEFRGPADAKIKRVVFGKTWNWNSNPEIHFPSDPAEIADALKSARRLD